MQERIKAIIILVFPSEHTCPFLGKNNLKKWYPRKRVELFLKIPDQILLTKKEWTDRDSIQALDPIQMFNQLVTPSPSSQLLFLMFLISSIIYVML